MSVVLDKDYSATADGSLVPHTHPLRRIFIGNAGDSIPDDIAAKWGLSSPPVAYASVANPSAVNFKREDYGPFPFAGTPSNGTSEVVTLTFSGTITGGVFRLKVGNYFTAPITWSATNATLVANIDAALGNLMSILGAANVTTAVGTMTSGIGTITCTFAGDMAAKDMPDMTVYDYSLLTGAGATVAASVTTPGVDATLRGVPKGALLIDTTNGVLYQNTGADVIPTWTKVGVQS